MEKASRQKGIAVDIIKRFLKQQEGKIGLYVSKRNMSAVSILEKILKKEEYDLDKMDVGNGTWFYRVAKIKK